MENAAVLYDLQLVGSVAGSELALGFSTRDREVGTPNPCSVQGSSGTESVYLLTTFTHFPQPSNLATTNLLSVL